MTVKERILAIHVMKSVRRKPEYASSIGIDASLKKTKRNTGDRGRNAAGGTV